MNVQNLFQKNGSLCINDLGDCYCSCIEIVFRVKLHQKRSTDKPSFVTVSFQNVEGTDANLKIVPSHLQN